MQLNPRVHASFKSLANEMRVVHSLDTPTRSSARRARGREASAALCLVLSLVKVHRHPLVTPRKTWGVNPRSSIVS